MAPRVVNTRPFSFQTRFEIGVAFEKTSVFDETSTRSRDSVTTGRRLYRDGRIGTSKPSMYTFTTTQPKNFSTTIAIKA